MSEHRNDFAPAVVSSPARPGPRRWFIAAVGALSLGGLAFGALLAPVSADDVTGSVGSGVSAEFDGNCVNAATGGAGAGGSVGPQGDDAPSGLDVTADGTGSAEASVCLDDLGQDLPDDPGGDLPGDPGGGDPGDPDGVVGEVTAAVLGELDGAVPGDPGDGIPGDPGDVVPGDLDDGVPGHPGDAVPGDLDDGPPADLGGLLPDGLGLVPDLLDRLPHLVPDGGDNNGPGGNDDGDGPGANPSAGGSGTASVVAGTGEGSAPRDQVPGGGPGFGVPGSTGAELLPAGGTLPRTGGGLNPGLLRMIAVLGIGGAALRLAGRHRAQPGRPA